MEGELISYPYFVSGLSAVIGVRGSQCPATNRQTSQNRLTITKCATIETVVKFAEKPGKAKKSQEKPAKYSR